MHTINLIQQNFDVLVNCISRALATNGDAALKDAVQSFSASLKQFESELSSSSTTQITQSTQFAAQQQTALAASVVVTPVATSPVTSTSALTEGRSSSANDVGNGVLMPGERGAGLPANYLKSPLYQDWLAKQPVLSDSVAEYGKAMVSWQESNPYYINPKNFNTFEAYAAAVENSTGGLGISADGQESLLAKYYGAAAVANPWAYLTPAHASEVANWSEPVQKLYQSTLAAAASRSALHKPLLG